MTTPAALANPLEGDLVALWSLTALFNVYRRFTALILHPFNSAVPSRGDVQCSPARLRSSELLVIQVLQTRKGITAQADTSKVKPLLPPTLTLSLSLDSF